MRAILAALLCAACAAPERLSRVPAGTYLLVVGDEPVLDAHSPFSGELSERFDVRGRPTAVTVTRLGEKAVVAREGGLTVRPLFEDRRPRFHELGATPADVATLNRRTRAAVVVPGALWDVDLRSGEVLARYATGIEAPVAVVVGPEDERVLVVGPGACVRADLGSGATARYDLEVEARAAARRPGTDEVWIVGRGTPARLRFGAGAPEPLEERSGAEARGVSFDARGEVLATTRVDPEGGSELRVESGSTSTSVALPAGAGSVRVAPTGDYAYVAYPEEDHVAVVDLERGEVTGTFRTAPGPHGIAMTFSRDRRPIGGW